MPRGRSECAPGRTAVVDPCCLSPSDGTHGRARIIRRRRTGFSLPYRRWFIAWNAGGAWRGRRVRRRAGSSRRARGQVNRGADAVVDDDIGGAVGECAHDTAGRRIEEKLFDGCMGADRADREAGFARSGRVGLDEVDTGIAVGLRAEGTVGERTGGERDVVRRAERI